MSTDVSDSTGYGPNVEMSVLGYLVAALVAVVLLPLLPVAAVGYALYRLLASESEEPPRRSWTRDVGRPPSDA